jgi:hypothetical protein
VSLASFVLPLALCGYVPGALLAQATTAAARGPARFDLTIPANATIGGFVQELRSRTGANIAVDTGVARIWLPGFQLKGVTVAGALAWIPSTRLAREAGVRVEPIRAGQDSSVVYVITRFGEARIGPQPSVRAFSLSDSAPRELRANELAQAVRSAVEKRNQAPLPPGAFVDPGTRLLFVTGTREDVDLASQIVDEATRGQRAAANDLLLQLRALRAKVDSLERRMNQAEPVRRP